MNYHSPALSSEHTVLARKSVKTEKPCEAGWYVVQTNPRCEERAAKGLRAAGITCFLPTYGRRVRRRFTASHRVVHHPLLTGYLFAQMTFPGPDCWTARRIDGVRKVLGLHSDGKKPTPVGQGEIAELMRLCEAGTFIERVAPARPFKRQDQLRIREGAFRGLCVHFEDYSGDKSARVLVSIFGRLSEVVLPLAGLEAA